MDRKLSALTVFLLLFACSTLSGAEPLPSTLDAGSSGCVSCHQDSITVSEPFEVCHQGGCDHPVGVSYGSLTLKNRGLVPADKLDPAITLVEGKMGCLACHTPYDAAVHETAEDSMLSVDNKGSALCVACHRK